MHFLNGVFKNIDTGLDTVEGIGVVVGNIQEELVTVIENNPENKDWKRRGQEGIIFGKKEEGENGIIACQREIQEESGIVVDQSNIVKSAQLDFFYPKGKNHVQKISLELFETVNFDSITDEAFGDNENEIQEVKLRSILELIEIWQNNNGLVRPLTLESIFAIMKGGRHKFASSSLDDGIYDEEYIQRLTKIVESIKKNLKISA